MTRALFQTPPNLPEEFVCRTFQIPSSEHWLAIFNAMALTLLNKYNWEQVSDTDLTVDETIALIRVMIQEYWDTEVCAPEGICLQPNGSRVLRLDANGHIQQMGNGAWEDPTGDYEVPPVPPREEATAAERRCAAAANAESVLAQTYELVTDMVADHIDRAEIIVGISVFLTATVAPFLGFVVPALVILIESAVIAFLEIAEYMTSDLWDADFSDLLKCVLLNCASDDGDVVTFDFTCVTEGMTASVNLLDEQAETYLRLYGQVYFMLQIIGVDGLNAAGATTGITDANCDDCPECVYWLDGNGNADWSVLDLVPGTPGGEYNALDDRYDATYRGGVNTYYGIYIENTSPPPFTTIGLRVTSVATRAGSYVAIYDQDDVELYTEAITTSPQTFGYDAGSLQSPAGVKIFVFVSNHSEGDGASGSLDAIEFCP